MERREMKRSSVVYLFIVSLLMGFLLEGGAWAEEPNDPNSCGCCEMDRPEDAPPAGSSISISSTAPLVMTSTSSSSNTKTFRTDSGPELDWYQPCSGGDNLIDFNINVHDVDISSIKSVTLTLAVWDVDYDCPLWCCERDSVYVNGHRLMTPEAYLTGANNQWSTVTFNVDPSWIVDGDNYVQIFIDLFCPNYWCVTCDWGELALELDEIDVKVVEIEALEDTSIRDDTGNAITDPIWSDDSPSQHKSVADASKDSWWVFTWGGSLKIQTHLDAEPSRPSWDPKCKYGWWILGTNKSDTGEFTGWDGEFTVPMPEKVGKYELTLMYEIYDDQDNQINFQSMTHDLYVTHKKSKLSNPKTNWLDKACEWGSGADNESKVADSTLTSIYSTGWQYDPTISSPSWEYTLENHRGDCRAYAWLWKNMNKALGVHKNSLTIYGNYDLEKSAGAVVDSGPNPFTTKKLRALDGQDKEWHFNFHQIGNGGGSYDPVLNIHRTNTEAYERALLKNFNVLVNAEGAFKQIKTEGTELEALISNKQISTEFSVGPQAYKYILTLQDGTTEFTDPPVVLDVSPAHNVIMIKTDKLLYSVAEPIHITGAYIYNEKAVKNISVIAEILKPNTAGATIITLYDDGTHGDDDANDGVYSALFWDTSVEGGYTIVVKASGVVNGISFNKEETLPQSILVKKDKVNFTETYVDQGVDEDSDSLFDILRTRVGIDVSVPGEYRVAGVISKDANDIAMTKFSTSLSVSETQLIIDFDGKPISAASIDGPYELTVEILDDDYVLIVQDDFQTSLYSYTQFQTSAAVFTGNYNDTGADADGDGSFDSLIVEAEVDVVADGNYVATSILTDLIGDEVARAQSETNLPAGISEVVLSFEGVNIHRHGKDGPYTLKSLVLYDADGNVVDARSNVYSTSSYSYGDFEAPSSAFRHTFTDYGVDTNGDGYFEFLVVEVGVDVASAGNYLLRGALHDKNGAEIILTSTDSYLNPGNQSMQLQFDGFSIYKHGVNGPYTLSYIILCTDNSRLMDAQAEAHVTSAYNYQDFQRPPVVLTGSYSDHATDLNSDGVYEYLTVDIEVIVANAGNYALNARLMDKDENEIVWASTTAWLPADQFLTMQLNFDGPSIYNHGVRGPYYVRDVYVYNMSNTNLSDYVYDAYVTTNHWPVGNEPPTANAGPDQSVKCAYNAEQGTKVTLDGTNSSDPEGDPLTYTWTGPFDESPTHGPTPTVTLSPGCPGDYVITLVVNDGTEDSNPDELVVTVQDPVTAVTYDGDTLLSTAGNPTVGATLIATVLDVGGNVLDIDEARVTFTLTADGVGTTAVEATSQDGLAHAVVTLEPAIYKIEMTLDCSGIVASAILVVYDPEGGFATGGGWIIPGDDGLNTHPNERANFGFNAKYKQGQATGHLEFRYSDGYIDLKSYSIEQLVITGGKIAQFKGWASVNAVGGYWFFVKAIDNGEPGINDIFDIKIWAPGVSPDGDPSERAGGVLHGGNILVHAKNK